MGCCGLKLSMPFKGSHCRVTGLTSQWLSPPPLPASCNPAPLPPALPPHYSVLTKHGSNSSQAGADDRPKQTHLLFCHNDKTLISRVPQFSFKALWWLRFPSIWGTWGGPGYLVRLLPPNHLYLPVQMTAVRHCSWLHAKITQEPKIHQHPYMSRYRVLVSSRRPLHTDCPSWGHTE